MVAFLNSFHYLKKESDQKINHVADSEYDFKVIQHCAKNYLQYTRRATIKDLKITLVAEDVVTKEQKIYFN